MAANVNFGDVTGYIELDAGTYDLIITTTGGGDILIDPRPVTFAEGEVVTTFATGDGANKSRYVSLEQWAHISILPP